MPERIIRCRRTIEFQGPASWIAKVLTNSWLHGKERQLDWSETYAREVSCSTEEVRAGDEQVEGTLFELWTEAKPDTQECLGRAGCLGFSRGETFEEAVDAFFREHLEQARYWNKDNRQYYGFRLFPSRLEAIKQGSRP